MQAERRERSASGASAKSHASHHASSMGHDGGEAGRRMAAEEDLIRRELHDGAAFCNAFWGYNDAGYPVMQSRMKGAARIVEEVRAMYRERAEIEADYAKRLSKLAKQHLGKDETGSMRNALETVRGEVEQTARTHADLANVFRKDLEGQLAEFQNRIQSQRKVPLANIEKLYKQKVTQESYVSKSREKYEQDCIRINGYTAQSSLVQGRDLEKVTSKLDKAQSTVNSNDKDYQNFIRALKDTTYRWNAEWKGYLDQCQDLEEERLEFLKSNLWNYANAISAVCVADDQSCERVRVSLETCEAPRDILDFIQRAGTGAAIPDPPEYINYSRGQPPPARPTFKTANFHRTTVRQPTFVASTAPPITQPPESGLPASVSQYEGNNRGSGGDGDATVDGMTSEFSRQTLTAIDGVAESTQQANQYNSGRYGNGSPTRRGQEVGVEDESGALPTSRTDKRMSAKNFLANVAMRNGKPSASNPATPQKPPMGMAPSDTNTTMGTTIIKPLPSAQSGDDTTADEEDDPIAKALADLRTKQGRSPAPTAGYGATPTKARGGYDAESQRRSNGINMAHGMDQRPRSPSAAFMQEPERATSPLPVEEILDQYGQSFPGERRSVSRQNSTASRQSRYSVQAPAAAQDRARSPGPEAGQGTPGFAGVGARGRSPSPQPYAQPSVHRSPPKMHAAGGPPSVAPRSPVKQAQANGMGPIRSTTPLGISLDASGSVTHDQMADEFMRRTGSVGPQQGRMHQASGPSAVPPGPQYGAAVPQQAPPAGYGQPGAPQYGGGGYANVSSPAIQRVQATQPPGQPSTPSRTNPPYGQAAAGGYQQTPPSTVRHPGGMPGPAGYQQTPPPAGGGYGSPSPYNQRPASATAPTAASGPAANAYGHPTAGAPSTQGGYAAAAPPPQNPAASGYAQSYQAGYQQTGPQHPATPVGQGGYPHGGVPSGQPAVHYPIAQPAAAQPQQQVAPQPQPQSAQTPQPPPTGQYSEGGKAILFYVKALYDYEAQLQEEFSFTAGDVIAVWETNPDGWWQGELLDDARRRPGANTFPSNFVSLLN